MYANPVMGVIRAVLAKQSSTKMEKWGLLRPKNGLPMTFDGSHTDPSYAKIRFHPLVSQWLKIVYHFVELFLQNIQRKILLSQFEIRFNDVSSLLRFPK